MVESYKTLSAPCEGEYKEKGSRFLGFAYPCSSPDEAETYLKTLRKKYYDASHHCSAYGLIDGTIKYSDDGEPSGTAGIRLMQVIESSGINNILLVVVRYFGGTKLGVGPLGKAYHLAAQETVGKAPTITKHAFLNGRIYSSFEQSGAMHRLLNRHSIRIAGTHYTDTVEYSVAVPLKLSSEFNSIIREHFHGSCSSLLDEKNVYYE